MSDHEGEDVKPKADVNVIHLVVKSLQGDETQFKVKKTTTFDKILKAYAGKKSLNKDELRLIFEGERLVLGSNPTEHDMEDGDVIDVVMEATGGL